MIDNPSDLVPLGARNCDPVSIHLMILETADQGVIKPNSDGRIHNVNLAMGKSSILGLRSVESKD
jgi:hypothetical protein